MKRFVFLLTTIFICTVAIAETINMHWLNDNGTTYTESTCTVNDDLIIPTTPPTKYGYTFTGWKISPFVQIEYLESTGTQYIDTGVKFSTPNNRIESRIVFFEGNVYYIFGAMNESPYFGLGKRDQTDIIFVVNSPILSATNTSAVAQNGILYDIVIQNTSYDSYVSINGSRTTLPFRGIITAKSILFGHIYENTFKGSHCRIAQFKIYDNDVLVRDFIPVLDGNGTPCMLDKVEGKFYYNAGTGQFIAGPVIGE